MIIKADEALCQSLRSFFNFYAIYTIRWFVVQLSRITRLCLKALTERPLDACVDGLYILVGQSSNRSHLYKGAQSSERVHAQSRSMLGLNSNLFGVLHQDFSQL